MATKVNYGDMGRPERDGNFQSPSGSDSFVKENGSSVKYSASVSGDKNPFPGNTYKNLDEGKEGNTSPREDETPENIYDNLGRGANKSGTISPLDKDYAYKK